jgi:hypothetical protein
MCCLKYEQDAYEDLLRRTPREESFVDTPEGRGTVVGIHLLRQQVKVQMEDSPETTHIFSNDEIAILRNGKAKKNDPPIPADLAPISGSGKRRRKPEPQPEEGPLDPIKFRYREESVVDEPVQEAEVNAEDLGKTASRRRRRHNKAEVRKEAPAAQPQPKEPAAVEPEVVASEKPRQNHHRRRHHRKPKNQGNANE